MHHGSSQRPLSRGQPHDDGPSPGQARLSLTNGSSKSPGSAAADSSPNQGTKSRGESLNPGAERVKVVIRVRPAIRADETEGAIKLVPEEGRLMLHRVDAPVQQSEFIFDKVLGPEATQLDVYNAAVRDVVDDVLKGYNGTVMAYGQTGAGKTFTLGNTQREAIGMIPRAVAEVFKKAEDDPFHDYAISMSYIQIYMELIQDLLNPASDNLVIREDVNNGVFVAGTLDVPIKSLEECLHYLELGERNRVFAFTHLNAHSSRSHVVTMVTVVKSRKYLTPAEKQEVKKAEREGMVTQKVKVGKLYLVDLAGSERLKKSRSVGLRATEAKSINLSLTCLGMCINARANEQPHVPFRQSKLTRLLQESLGGNAKTTLLLCACDVVQHAEETLQSLQFGSRAMRVSNRPQVNERLDYKLLSAELQGNLDSTAAQTHHVEIALFKTEEERDALQAELEQEKLHFAGILDQLRREAADSLSEAQSAARAALEAHRREAETAHRELDNRNAETQRTLAEQRNALQKHEHALGAAQIQGAALEERLRQTQMDKERMALVHYAEISEMNGHIHTMQVEYESQVSTQQELVEGLRVELATAQAANAVVLAAAEEYASSAAQAAVDAAEAAAAAAAKAAAAASQEQRLLQDATATLQAELAAMHANQQTLHLALAQLQQVAGALAPLNGCASFLNCPAPSAAASPLECAPAPASSLLSRPPVPLSSPSLLDPEPLCCDSPTLAQMAERAASSSVGRPLTQATNPAFGTRVSRDGPVSFGDLEGQLASLRAMLQDAQHLRSRLEASGVAAAEEAAAQQAHVAALEAEIVLYEAKNTSLGERVKGDMKAAEAAQQRIETLMAQVSELGGHLDTERSGRTAATRQLQQTTLDHSLAVEKRLEARRSARAALTIQRAFRSWKTRSLKQQLEDDAQVLHQMQLRQRGVHRAAQLQAAQLGAGLVRESLGVIREAVDAVIAAFLVPHKDLQAHKRVQQLSTASRATNAASRGRAPSGGSATSQLSCRSFVRVDPLATVATPLPPSEGTVSGSSGRWGRNVSAHSSSARATPATGTEGLPRSGAGAAPPSSSAGGATSTDGGSLPLSAGGAANGALADARFVAGVSPPLAA